MSGFSLLQGDSLSIPLADLSVQAVVTSPPYFGLRTYGDSRSELGRGSLNEYLEGILASAREIKRVLADDGLFWLNIGDTAAGSGGAGGDYNKGGFKDGKVKWKQGDTGLKPMQWCLVPFRIAGLLQDDGWLVRQVVTWDKGQLRPESLKHVRRPGVSSELVLMLAKTRSHRFFEERLPAGEKGNVWHFPPARTKSGHPAPFPAELARRCIGLSTEVGDYVFDPFAGSGTTAKVARNMGRIGIGMDLYENGGSE